MTKTINLSAMDGADVALIEEQPAVELDLRYQHYRKQHGPITVILTWNWAVEPGEVPDAMLVLAPTRWDTDNEEPPTLCCVQRNDAWRWSRTHNNDRHMIGHWAFGRPPASENWQKANAIYYALCLGLEAHESRTINRIRGLIEDYLDDLVSMPPAPIRELGKDAHATFEVTDLKTGSMQELPVSLD